jgi:hypothetical protein
VKQGAAKNPQTLGSLASSLQNIQQQDNIGMEHLLYKAASRRVIDTQLTFLKTWPSLPGLVWWALTCAAMPHLIQGLLGRPSLLGAIETSHKRA